MALTLGRWISAAVVGCALIFAAVVLRVGRDGDEQRERLTRADVLDRQRGQAKLRLTSAVEQMRVRQIGDSLATSPATRDAARGVMLVDAGFSADYRQLFDAAFGGQVAATSPAGVPVDVAFVLDSGSVSLARFNPEVAKLIWTARHLAIDRVQVDYFLPASAHGGRCLVLVRLNPLRNGLKSTKELLTEQATTMLGPCAYYKSFGPPGASVDRWLRARGWSLSERTAWDQRSPALAEEDRYYWPGSSFTEFDGERARRYLRTSGIRCNAGDRQACESAVLDQGDRAATWGGGILSWDGSSGPLGRTAERSLLSEMVRTLGRERFARFWQSPEVPSVAFRAATGVSLGEWTHDYMLRVYGAQGRGPGLASATIGVGALLLLLGLSVGVRSVSRRTVG